MTQPETFLNGRVTLYGGDCFEVLKQLPSNSLDSCCCDPPYHLTSIVKRFGANNAAPAKAGKTGAYARASRGFMGKTWDGGDIAFQPELWAEVLRVLKPGAHLLAFSGTRTYHRMACAIEDAGFDIRDMTAWMYGSGFPKSHDVSKGIDKAGGLNPHDQASLLRTRRQAAGLSRESVAEEVGCTVASVRDWEDGRARATGRALEWITPSEPYRSKLAGILGYSADERLSIGIAQDRRDDGSVYDIGHSGILKLGGQTDAASQWEGWGTALKPALEPIVLARKALDGTVAANVLKHGTGALNIGACRVGTDAVGWGGAKGGSEDKTQSQGRNYRLGDGEARPVVGRWPANVCHDGSDEVIGAFPIAPGQQQAVGPRHGKKASVNVFGDYGARDLCEPRGDSGSAARFFYSAKADADDRIGSTHPTVKPVDLMQYLVRLITPKGGTTIDPFAGTGTTGEAAWREGMNAVLIEREEPYRMDIARRMALCLAGPDERARASIKARHGDLPAGPLFDMLAVDV